MEHYIYKEVKNGVGKQHKKSAVYFWRQLLVSSGVWMSFFSYGLSLGACTVVIPQLKREANSTEAVTDSMASWISSGSIYGAFVSLIFTSITSEYFGRKATFLFASAVTIAANILFYFSVNSIYLLISETIQGVNAACLLTVNLMVVVEYTSPTYRGVFLNIKTAMMYWGVWAANAIGTFFHWRNIAVLGIVCSIYAFVTSSFWPESPFWLASKGRIEECVQSHRWLRGKYEDSEKELDLLLKTNELINVKSNDGMCNFFKKLKNSVLQKEFYKPTLICILLLTMYYSTGKIVFSVYAVEVIKKITLSEKTSYMTMLFLDGITVFGMYVGSGVSKFVRRRIMFMSCSLVGIVSLFILSIYLFLVYMSVIKENNYVALPFLTIFSLAISAGPIVLSTSILGEIAPIKLRNLSFFLIMSYNCFALANIVKIAPAMFFMLKIHGAILTYVVLSSFFLYLVYKYLPETKDKTIHEIREIMLKERW